MPQRTKVVLLAVLAVLFAFIVYLNFRSPGVSAVPASADLRDDPIAIENPALRLDLLEHLKTLQYQGSHRNIFSAAAPAAAAPRVIAKPAPAPPPGPPPVAPLVVPATFFGYVTDARTGVRRAFFSEGDDVFVVGVGDILLGRFRLLQIGNSTAELEETASGRRATVTLQEPGPS
jgi:hypothetical protein